MRFKIISGELLTCALEYSLPDGSGYDWEAFSQSVSDDEWADEQGMRLLLAALGLSMEAGVEVIG